MCRTLLVVLLALAASGRAQSFQITDGNVVLVRHPRPVPGLFSTRLTATTCAETHVQGDEWCYAIAGAGASGNAIDGAGHGGYTASAPDPATFERRIQDLDSAGRCDAVVLDHVLSTGPHGGVLVTALSVTNTSGMPLAVRVYYFANVDLNESCCGEYGDFTLSCSTPDRVIVGDLADCGGTCTVAAPGAAAYEVDEPALLASRIVAGLPLRNVGLPFGSAAMPRDLAVAFGWDVSIQPGDTASFAATIECDRGGQPGSVSHSGTVTFGHSSPRVDAPNLPRVGFETPIRVTGLGGSGAAVLLFAATAAPSQVPVLGIDLLAQPVITTVPLVPDQGAADYVLRLGCDSALRGFALTVQGVAVDPGSPADLPLSHSDLLTLTFGD